LVLTLLRLVDPSSGSVRIDGVDLKSAMPNEIRSRIIAVAEEPFLFSGTIRRNMDPYGNFDDTLIIEALDDTQLWKLVSDQGGLDAKLEPEMFSHGQKQLFNIARAVLRRRNGKLLILDEATSRCVKRPTRLDALGLNHKF
jgi:ATP-binding cassette, subfamily C (CFTR/MRP), member 1